MSKSGQPVNLGMVDADAVTKDEGFLFDDSALRGHGSQTVGREDSTTLQGFGPKPEITHRGIKFTCTASPAHVPIKGGLELFFDKRITLRSVIGWCGVVPGASIVHPKRSEKFL